MPSHGQSSHSGTEGRDHAGDITARVIAALEAGAPPWRRPWDDRRAISAGMPRNAVTGAKYRGINVVTLGLSPFGFLNVDPRWATYKQAADRGWQVRKGERGTLAVFYKRLPVRDEQTDPDSGEPAKTIPLLRAFVLFHASQINGIPPFVPPPAAEAHWRSPDAVETIMANSGMRVREGDRACYAPATDTITMPRREAFPTAGNWSSTILHEASHATAAPHRLNRDLRNRFGSPDYAREELRVHIAQSIVCAELNIDGEAADNTTAYLSDWLQALRSDRKEIFRAAADAQRIADYLLAFHPDYARQNSGCEPEPGTLELAEAA
jgi:antirestriction protein ArdC